MIPLYPIDAIIILVKTSIIDFRETHYCNSLVLPQYVNYKAAVFKIEYFIYFFNNNKTIE